MLNAEGAVGTVHAGDAHRLVAVALAHLGTRLLRPALHLRQRHYVGVVVDAEPCLFVLPLHVDLPDTLALAQSFDQTRHTLVALILDPGQENGDFQLDS